ncbi:MepB family protein [Enterococcus sp.]|uniref:MepB family protein n=1 Tax=Enterococcus sp. TaxID=35783 RepID=UPI003992770C
MRQSEKLMTALLKMHHISGPTKIQTERQNSVYEGMTFVVGNTTFRSRLAKKTPKKKGYFTALWEQPHEKNQAYSLSGYPDKLMITVLDGKQKGQFVFPSSVLVANGIIKTETTAGKMAFRVYPPWVQDLNPTASRTQNWQTPYFLDLSEPLKQTETLEKFYFH